MGKFFFQLPVFLVTCGMFIPSRYIFCTFSISAPPPEVTFQMSLHLWCLWTTGQKISYRLLTQTFDRYSLCRFIMQNVQKMPISASCIATLRKKTV